jgi:tetratricopeptide (TPR) repeat protein
MTAHEALEALDHIFMGPERLAAAQLAVRLADEEGDEDLAYRARMRLTSAASWLDDTEIMIPSYGWCVAKHDSDPARFPIDPFGEEDGADLLFQGKWMASDLAQNSGFPLAQIESVVDDLERRFREAGLSMHGLLQVRRDLALSSGDVGLAQRITAERDLHPKDDHSHCDACVRSSDVDLALASGDTDRAMALWQEIHEGNYSCGEEPERVDATMLLPMLRAGRADEALAMHAAAYRLVRQYHAEGTMFAQHLPFLAVSGNLTRGLDMIERHLPSVAAAPFNERSTMHTLSRVAVLLDALADAGRGDVPVRGSDEAGLRRLLGHEGVLTAAQFAERAWSAADELARGLDERDRTTGSAAAVQRRRALRGERIPAAFGGEGYTPAAAATEALPSDARGWASLARRRQMWGGSVADVEEAREKALTDPRFAPVVWSDRIDEALDRGDETAVTDMLARRIAALRAAGWGELAEVQERLGRFAAPGAEEGAAAAISEELDRGADDPDAWAWMLAAFLSVGAQPDADEPDGRLTAIDAALDSLTDEDPFLLFVRLATLRVVTLLNSQRGPEAGEFALQALRDPRAAGQPAGELRRLGAIGLAHADRRDEAIEILDGLLADVAQADGQANYAAEVARTAGLMLAETGRFDESVARFEFAARASERSGEPDPSITWQLGSAQHAAGYMQAALETFEDIYRAESAAEAAPSDILPTLVKLAEVAQQAGVTVQTALGNLEREHGDPDAIDAFEAALEAARELDDDEPWTLVEALHNLGAVRMQFGDAAGEANLDEAQAVATAADNAPAVVDIEISRGVGLRHLEDVARAAAVFEGAADRAAEFGGGIAAVANMHAAVALEELGELARAETRYRTSLANGEQGTGVYSGAVMRLAAMLDGQGREGDANELRGLL